MPIAILKAADTQMQDPDQPVFATDRFIVAPLCPESARKLMLALLSDAELAEQWLQDVSPGAAAKSAAVAEVACAVGTMKAWGIVEAEGALVVGAVFAQRTLRGVHVEVIYASPFWRLGVVEEVTDPVADWMEHGTELPLTTVH